jgi:toxin ParE1/3/4
MDYTAYTWGTTQADRYLEGFVDCFERISQMPNLGRRCESVHSGFRRIEVGRHVVFYRASQSEVFISRVLHQQMKPDLKEFTDADDDPGEQQN